MIKRFLIAGILVALVCGGIIWFNMFRDQKIAEFFQNMPVKILTISATTVEPEDWLPSIDTIGSAKAAQGVELAFETTGVVRSVDFKANEKVAAGQVLATLDSEVERALEPSAQSALDTTKAQLDRLTTLRKSGVVAQKDFDTAHRDKIVSEAELARLRAVIRQKTLKAPFAGVIGIPRIDLGEYVQPGTLVATLQDLDRMFVDFTVPEQRAHELSIGQKARFGMTADDISITGEIIGIDPKVDTASRLVSVRAEVDNRDGKLIPGQFLQVRVQLPTQPNTIVLPQTALVTSLYGDYVFTLRPVNEDPAKVPEGAKSTDAKTSENAGGQATSSAQAATGPAPAEAEEHFKVLQVFVKPGRRTNGTVEITSGLKAGDLVVTAGQNKIQSGSTVRVDNSIDPAQTARLR